MNQYIRITTAGRQFVRQVDAAAMRTYLGLDGTYAELDEVNAFTEDNTFAGKVGIGTDTPIKPLHIYNATNGLAYLDTAANKNSGLIIASGGHNGSAGNGFYGLFIDGNDTSSGYLPGDGTGVLRLTSYHGGDFFDVFTVPAVSHDIQFGGSVAIGGAVLSGKALTVNGDVAVRISGSSGNQFTLYDDAASFIYFQVGKNSFQAFSFEYYVSLGTTTLMSNGMLACRGSEFAFQHNGYGNTGATVSASGGWTIPALATTTVPLTVKGAPLQSANLLEAQDNNGNPKVYVSPATVYTGMDNYFLALKPGNRAYRIGTFDANGSFAFTCEGIDSSMMVQMASGSVSFIAYSASGPSAYILRSYLAPIVLSAADAGGTGQIQLGKRFSDGYSGCGASVEVWTNTGQTLPALTILAPGGGSSVASISPAGAGTFTNITDSALTAGRIPFATTGGQLTDNASLRFDSSTKTTKFGPPVANEALFEFTGETGMTVGVGLDSINFLTWGKGASTTFSHIFATGGGTNNLFLSYLYFGAKIETPYSSSPVLILQAKSGQSEGFLEARDSSNIVLASLNANATILTMPSSFAIGSGTHALGGVGNTILGRNATCNSTGESNVIIGDGANVASGGTLGTLNVVIGNGSSSKDYRNVAIGDTCVSTAGNSTVLIGYSLSSSVSRQVNIGTVITNAGGLGVAIGADHVIGALHTFACAIGTGVITEAAGELGFGTNTTNPHIRLRRHDSTTEGVATCCIKGEFADDTHATRKGRITIQATDYNGDREGIRVEGDGSAPLLSFFGGTAAAKPTVTGSRGGNAALASLLTALAALGLITDSTTA